MHCFVWEQDCEGFLGRYTNPLEDTGRRFRPLVDDVDKLLELWPESGTEVFVETVLVVFRIVLVDLEDEGMDLIF